jgi:hypothetical protein
MLACWLFCLAQSLTALRTGRFGREPRTLLHRGAPSGNVSELVAAPGASSSGNISELIEAQDLFTPMKVEQCEIARDYTAEASLCSVGSDRFRNLDSFVPGFAQLWAKMKVAFAGAPCCMGINHLFAVYHMVLTLQPQVIIESGVAAGHTTWLLRQVAPNAQIFCLDPVDSSTYKVEMQGIQGYHDPAAVYLTGPSFQDLSAVRWDQLIPDAAARARTLVILDDHQSALERVKMLRRWGFVDLFYEDNYPFRIAASHDSATCPNLAALSRTFTKSLHGDAYSPNTMCAPLPAGTSEVLQKDRFGKICRVLTIPEHKANVAYFQSVLSSYFEYPALFRDCAGARRPALLRDAAQLAQLGLPSQLEEIWGYGHLHPPLMRLKPVLPANAAAELQTAIRLAVKFSSDVAAGVQMV